jgi:predicted RNase H-like HicB family nuclease
MTTYIATVHKENNSDYGVQFYDFPGCISVGETIEEAQKMAIEALNGHIELMLEDGDFIPNPSPLEVIIKDQDHQSATAFLIVNIDLQVENNDRELVIN